MEYARSRGYKELKHHLLPRTKGFHLITQLAKEKGNVISLFEHNSMKIIYY